MQSDEEEPMATNEAPPEVELVVESEAPPGVEPVVESSGDRTHTGFDAAAAAAATAECILNSLSEKVADLRAEVLSHTRLGVAADESCSGTPNSVPTECSNKSGSETLDSVPIFAGSKTTPACSNTSGSVPKVDGGLTTSTSGGTQGKDSGTCRSTPRHQYNYECPLKYCPASMRRDKLREHAFRRHLPLCFKCTPTWGNMRQVRSEALGFLIRELRLGSWGALFEFVRQKWQSMTTEISEGVVSEMRYLCKLHGWPIPSKFETHPPGSPAVLIHWRPLLFLVGQLPDAKRRFFQSSFSSSSSKVGPPAVVRSEISSTPKASYAAVVCSGNPKVEVRGTPSSINPGGSVQKTPMASSSKGTAQVPAIGSKGCKQVSVTPVPNSKGSTQVSETPASYPKGSVHVNETLESAYLSGSQTMGFVSSRRGTNSCPGMGDPGFGSGGRGVPAPQMGIRDPLNRANLGSGSSVPVVQGSSMNVRAPALLRGFDAHFHLDRMKTHVESIPRTQREHVSQQPQVPLSIIGGVRNYCDPESFHEMPVAVDHPWHLAIGIHPKKAQTYTAEQWDFFEKKLALSMVTGISEVGLDYSHSPTTWDAQQRLLERILRLGVLGFVLILHVRGARSDVLGQEVHRRVFDQVKRYCSRYQRIHLHSFAGSVSALVEWFEHFPHCFASFSGLVRTFNPGQVQALRVCPLERLLIETDSPYLTVRPEVRINTPQHLGEVALLVAQLRNEPFERVVTATRRNGLHLYFGFPNRLLSE